MNNYVSKVLTVVAFVFLAAWTVSAQSTEGPSKPVVVTNTAANPVPVAGQVNVGTMPAVDAKQSGIWNVGLTGIPAVRLDPQGGNRVEITNEILAVAPRTGRYDGKFHNWADGTGQITVDSESDEGSGGSSKLLVCVKNRAPLPIFAHVFMFIPFSGNNTILDRIYELEVFAVSSNRDVCKVYDAYGIFARVIVQSNGNTTGNMSIGISER
jgi:hypothetical protein